MILILHNRSNNLSAIILLPRFEGNYEKHTLNYSTLPLIGQKYHILHSRQR